MRLLIRVVANAIALWVAVLLVPGITSGENFVAFLGLAVLFGLINALIRPIAMFLSCPLRVLTLGLFTLVINAGMLWLTSIISQALGFNFTVGGDGIVSTFVAALLGGIVISIVSLVLNIFVPDEKD